MTRTLVVLVPHWPAVASGIRAREPAIVVRANRVLAATPAARAAGVRIGLRRREAQARCPEVAVLQADADHDARAFEPVVAALADRLTPKVEIVVPGHLALPTRGPSRYFGGDEALARLAASLTAEVLAARGLDATPFVGVADGPFAALLAARAAGRGGEHAPVVVPPGGSPGFLAPLPVQALALAGAGETLPDVLRQLGMRTLGAFAALDAGHVAGRFGTAGLAAHRLAGGREERPPSTAAVPPDLTARAELDPPAEQVETVAFVARGLADRLAVDLEHRGLACTLLRITAETEHGERLERRWRGDGAGGASALTAGAIADRVRWQLDGWLRGTGADRPTAGVTLLELVPDEVVPATGRQLGLWGADPAAGARAVRAVARVAGLLGPDAVAVPEWRGGRAPAEQLALVPAVAVDLDPDRPLPLTPAPVAPPPVAPPPVAPTRVVPAGDRARPPLAVVHEPARHHVHHVHPQGPDRVPGSGPPSPPVPAPPRPDVPPWPGRLPAPGPAAVPPAPVPVEVVDGAGRPVGVTGRGLLTTVPARLRVPASSAAWVDITAWAGPWPAEERWWDRTRHRRRARLQTVDADGVARLLALEAGGWSIEATYD